MRVPTFPLVLFVAALCTACGGGGGPGTDVPDDSTGIHVDAVHGSDVTGNGTVALPYKSIKRGIQGAPLGAVVHVAPGTYDVANGERFPIVPGFGITITGTNRFSRGQSVNVVGGGLWSGDPEGRLHATFVPNEGNVLFGLSISNPQPFVIGGPKPAAVVMALSGATVEACTLHHSDKGVRMVNSALDILVKDCTIARNVIGIFVDGAGINNRVEGCLLTENNAGVFAGTGGVDCGGGPWSSLGGNAFTLNTANDFVHATGLDEVLFAGDCFWDHVAPTLATGNPASSLETDVWILVPGSVNAFGAQLYVPLQLPPLPVGP